MAKGKRKLRLAWQEDDAIRLKYLYDERHPEGMSQDVFGHTFGIGSQGMVWQYISGTRPLNIEAAAKFAAGLRCTIADISPTLADMVRRQILPVLGGQQAFFQRERDDKPASSKVGKSAPPSGRPGRQA